MPPKLGPAVTSDSTDPVIRPIFAHVDRANQYAQEVVAGRVLACKWVRLACQRHLDNLRQSLTDAAYAYEFDPAKASRACRFIEQLPHTKGDWALAAGGRDIRIKLEPWQCFIYSAVFGWVKRFSGLRRFSIAYICVPRKNGKSILAAGTGLYMFASDAEMGAEVYAGATCQRQAMEVFRPAKQMVERTPRLSAAFGIAVSSKNLAILENGSRFEPVVGNPGDGSSPSCAIVDEYHEHRNDQLLDSMRTGMGARKQPLLWVITTAGVNIAGPCHALQSDVQKVLEGTLQRDEVFGIIYTIDEDVDWTSEVALRMANPNYGVSVFADFLESEQAAAIQNSRKQNIFKTKHLNIWCGASSAWMNMERWKALADPTLKLEDFAGEPVNIGTDLSSIIDITSSVLVFKRTVDEIVHYYVFSRNYLPRDRALDPEKQHYQQWVHAGELVAIEGPVIDYSVIRRDLVADADRFNVESIAFDPWCAPETQQELMRELGEERVITIPQRVQYLSHPMKQLESLVLEGRIHHDGDPVLTWMMSNVVAHADANENIFPRKEQPENKIDGAVALIMGLSRALADSGMKYQEYNGF